MKPIVIESGIPFPHAKYPLAEMKVGDSFQAEVKNRQNLYSACQRFVRQFPSEKRWKFGIRSISPGVFRVWRTK